MDEVKAANKRDGRAKTANSVFALDGVSARKTRGKDARSDHRYKVKTPAKTAIPSAEKASTNGSTKKDNVIALLMLKGGASIDELIKATGWQAHSVRGFLSGTIGKKLGLKLSSSIDASGTRRYAIKR